MTTWSRTGSADFDNFGFHIRLGTTMWTSVHADGQDRSGQDEGGEIAFIREIAEAIKDNENFNAYVVSRRATKTFFTPEIVVNGEALPESLVDPKSIRALALGPQYDIFVSFATKEEMTMFKLSFRDGVNLGYGGLN